MGQGVRTLDIVIIVFLIFSWILDSDYWLLLFSALRSALCALRITL